jgi:hypothetical protein
MSNTEGTRQEQLPELSEHVKALARFFLDSCYSGPGHLLSKSQIAELEAAGLVFPLGNGNHAETPLMRKVELY